MHWNRKQGDTVTVRGHTHEALEGRDNATLVFDSPVRLTVPGT